MSDPAQPSKVPHTHGQGGGGEGIHPPHGGEVKGKYFYLLALGALGIVYGDIGTSPLYALVECFYSPHHAIEPTRDNVFGVLSLIVWSLIIVISIKYLVFVMRADNRGEGGILALMALLKPRGMRGVGRSRPVLVALGLFGAALLYGDGVITPAITTLSAIEGLKVAIPGVSRFVIPITLVIIVGLFVMQRFGTGGIGKIFGPVMMLWFGVLAVLGISQIARDPFILTAISPHYAMSFFLRNGWHGFIVLGTVFLVVTGGEALYADMGHFGKKPIKLAWFAVVLPALLLNYFGQGVLILHDPVAAREHAFFNLAPDWATLPLVALATVAASIASQAVISGAFSLTRQAIQLGYSPRMLIEHTSAREIGQIYVPAVNWALMVATLMLVVSFKSASNLAAAYGIAVTATMGITTVLYFVLLREKFGWKTSSAVLFLIFFLVIDLAFFGANALKIIDGGWVPLAMASAVYLLMATWKRGRQLLGKRMREKTMPLDLLLNDIGGRAQMRVPGTAVFMTGNPDGAPPALMHNLKHNKVLHEQVILLTIRTMEVSHVREDERLSVSNLSAGFYRVIAQYGFMEEPRVPDVMGMVRETGIKMTPLQITYFLGRDTLIVTGRKGMLRLQKKLFEIMSRNARSATAYFGIPYNQVVELGAQIEL